MYTRFGILQVLLILSTGCYSIKIKNNENKTMTIKITIPITSGGIGSIRVDEIKAEDECCGKPDTRKTIPLFDEPEMEFILPEPIDNNEINETVAVPIEEPIFESIQASGTINILGNFGPTLSGDPFIYPMYRSVPLYPIYTPAPSDKNSSDALEDPEEHRLINGVPTPNTFYRPVPLYPTFPSVIEDSASSEESEQIDGLSTPCSTYRPLPMYPFCPPQNNPNRTDLPVQNKEPLTLNDDTRRLLRNLMLLNIAHQSNIPCEIVPVPQTNRAVTEDQHQPTEIEIEDDGTPSIVPVSGKVTIVATNV